MPEKRHPLHDITGAFCAYRLPSDRYISTYGYIHTAIYGSGFCVGTKSSFFLILRNASTAASLAGIGGVVMMVGRLCITGISALTCFVAIKTLPQYAQQSTTPLYSTFVTTLVVYLMTGAFMAVLVSQPVTTFIIKKLL